VLDNNRSLIGAPAQQFILQGLRLRLRLGKLWALTQGIAILIFKFEPVFAAFRRNIVSVRLNHLDNDFPESFLLGACGIRADNIQVAFQPDRFIPIFEPKMCDGVPGERPIKSKVWKP